MKPLHGDAEHWFGECAKLIAERDALATDWRVASGAAIMLRTELADMRSERDALAQRCRELEVLLHGTSESYALRCDELQKIRLERDTLRAEVADLKARLLEAERGAEELVRLRAEMRDLIGRLKNIVTNPCESKEALAFRVGHLLEHAACATTDGATPAA